MLNGGLVDKSQKIDIWLFWLLTMRLNWERCSSETHIEMGKKVRLRNYAFSIIQHLKLPIIFLKKLLCSVEHGFKDVPLSLFRDVNYWVHNKRWIEERSGGIFTDVLVMRNFAKNLWSCPQIWSCEKSEMPWMTMMLLKIAEVNGLHGRHYECHLTALLLPNSFPLLIMLVMKHAYSETT